MKKWIQKLLPDYAIRPLILALAANFIIYFGVSQLRDHLAFHSLALPVDDRIPFFAPFIIFYILYISDCMFGAKSERTNGL